MADLQLQAQTRTATRKAVADLRQDGLLPAVLYGPELKTSQMLVIPQQVFDKVFRAAGANTLIDLVIGDTPSGKVLIHDVQYDPVKHVVVHADLYKVDMTKKINATVPLIFVGESPAVHQLGGVLIKNVNELEVRCLPTDLVKEIPVDISVLKNFHDTLNVGNLSIPAGLEVMTALDINVVLIAEPRAEEVVVVTTPAVGAGVATEGATPAEGEAAPSGDEPAKESK